MRCSRSARRSCVVAALGGDRRAVRSTPFDPAAQDLRASARAARPLAHPFGLDELGRDILARVLAGARISFLVGLAVVIGVGVGRHAARRGRRLLRRRVDDVISRVIDILLAFPGLLLAIALVAVLGPSLAQRAVRADDHRLGRLRAARARAGAARARVRIRAGGASARRAARRASSGGTSSRPRSRRSSCRRRSAWRARSSAKPR